MFTAAVALLTALAHAEPAPSAEPIQTVELTDGQTLRGHLAQTTPEGIELVLADGMVLPLPAAAIAEVRTEAGAPGTVGQWGLDPSRSRTLYAPTAFSLGMGEGYVAQRELALTSVGLGLTSFLDVEVGTVLPTLFSSGKVGSIAAKVAAPLTDDLRVGAGAQAFVVTDSALGFAFANVTIGQPDKHLTVAGGGALEFTTGDLGFMAATISGSWRLGPKSALITENWILYFVRGDGPWGGPFFAVPSGAVRLFGERWSVDLGVVPIFTGERDLPLVPAPWVSFAWNFQVGAK